MPVTLLDIDECSDDSALCTNTRGSFFYNSALTGVLASFALKLILTCASHSISTVSVIADTSKGPRCVGTLSIFITRRLLHTFINV